MWQSWFLPCWSCLVISHAVFNHQKCLKQEPRVPHPLTYTPGLNLHVFTTISPTSLPYSHWCLISYEYLILVISLWVCLLLKVFPFSCFELPLMPCSVCLPDSLFGFYLCLLFVRLLCKSLCCYVIKTKLNLSVCPTFGFFVWAACCDVSKYFTMEDRSIF